MIEKRIWREGAWYSKTKRILVVRTGKGKRKPGTRCRDVRLAGYFRNW
ncbi:MAG: hypothetical protein ABFD18_06320 [Syntrophomonas sp.]